MDWRLCLKKRKFGKHNFQILLTDRFAKISKETFRFFSKIFVSKKFRKTKSVLSWNGEAVIKKLTLFPIYGQVGLYTYSDVYALGLINET